MRALVIKGHPGVELWATPTHAKMILELNGKDRLLEMQSLLRRGLNTLDPNHTPPWMLEWADAIDEVVKLVPNE